MDSNPQYRSQESFGGHARGGRSIRSDSSSSSLTNNNVMDYLPQQDLENISAEEILEKNYEHNGFLYKRAQEKMTDHVTESVSSALNTSLFSKWQLRYVILYHEYVVYYKNNTSPKPKGVFSLRGYNRVARAEEMTSANQQWAFKLIGMRADDRTWYFAAASEREMRLWMAFFKVMMEKAIHGKARDKSLRILKDLKYKETKFLQGGDQATSNPCSFEPGLYEDIEEPLESECEADYLPPNPGPSVRQLPVPPRSESLETFNRPLPIPRTPLPVLPPRPEPPQPTCRGLGSRTQSDPTPPPHRRDRTISCISTPQFHHRSSAPASPGSRPKYPEPSFLMFQHSLLSTESGDYIQPPQVEDEQVEQFRSHQRQFQLPEPSPVRQPPRQPPQRPVANKQRQGPEGNSFRNKPHVETPATKASEIQDMRQALKPAVPHKPKLEQKPMPGGRPQPPLKPKPVLRSPVRKEPAFRDLLPISCRFNSSDKRRAEGMLYETGMDGIYLLRESSEPGKHVLMVYHRDANVCKHYKVFGNEVDTFSLTAEVVFQDMQQLLQHYSDNPLPNTHVRLSQPYPGYPG